MDYKLIEVKPKVFLLDFKDRYDLCMFFMRYQEFYESPSPQFRGKAWDWITFMRWYSKKYGKGAFTYADDWAGFNLPGDVIRQIWDLGIPDANIYDYEMREVYRECKKLAKGDFYLIGAVGKNGALKHEIAHGFFYTFSDYKKEMTKLVKALDPALRKGMNKVLSTMGYTPKVFVDECQAYLSTGPSEHFDDLKISAAIRKPFIKLYESYYKQK